MKTTGKGSAIIKAIMKDKKVSVQKLADTMGLAKNTIYNTFSNDINSERNGMSYENVFRFAEALGCEVIIRDKETGKEY